MRTDLLVAMLLGCASLFLGLLGYFVLDWSLVLVGLLAVVFVAADGYFLYGIVQMAKERQAGNAP